MDGPDGPITVEQLAMAYDQVGFLAVSGSADRAVLVGRRALAAAQQLGDEASAVLLRHAVGLALSQLRQYGPALDELAVASVQAERMGRPALQAVVWATAAWTEVLCGRPEEGLRTYARAHAALESEPPSRDTVIASVNLGLTATQLGLLDLGGQWFDYAKEHYALLPGVPRKCAVWANESLLLFEQGLAHEHAGAAAEARRWYERCAEMGPRVRALVAAAEPAHAGPWRLSAAVNQGCCKVKLGDPEGALRELDPAMDDVETQTVLITRAAAYLGRSWASLAVGDLAGCRRDGERAVRLADAIGWARWQADAHRALARAAGQAGDPVEESAHEARATDLLAQLAWQSRLRRLGVTLGLRAG